MNKIHAALAIAVLALSAGAFAQDADAARQQRMDQAYADSHREGTAARVEDGAKRDARALGHAIRDGARATGHAVHAAVRATGHAVHAGVKATGHAIHQGVKATGRAIHEGVDKITGK